MLVVGVDACKTGWIAVASSDGAGPEAHYLRTINDVEAVAPTAEAIAIDIPIGIPGGGPRPADLEARRFLGPRRSSVFLTPVREALEAPTHALATHAARTRTGHGISQQAFALGKKVLEVERWLPSSPCPVYEVHPEVSFAILLGRPASAPKKTWAGMLERRAGLHGAGIRVDEVDGEAVRRAAVDDMLDATVAAWTAARIVRGEARSFPDPPETRGSGRRVAIWA